MSKRVNNVLKSVNNVFKSVNEVYVCEKCELMYK